MLVLEKDIEKSFVRRLKKELGLTSAKLTIVSNAGYPDRLVPLKNGVTVYIEFKTFACLNNLSAHQKSVIDWLRANGHHVLVTASVEDAINFCIRHGLPKGTT